MQPFRSPSPSRFSTGLFPLLLAVAIAGGPKAAAAFLLAGKVVDEADRPVAGATLSLAGRQKMAIADSLGEFVLHGGSAVLDVRSPGFRLPAGMGKVAVGMRFSGALVHLALPGGRAGSLNPSFRIFDVTGAELRGAGPVRAVEDGLFRLFPAGLPAAGIYFCKVEAGGFTGVNRFQVREGRIVWASQNLFLGEKALPTALRRAASTDTLRVQGAGFSAGAVLITQDTALGLVLRLGSRALKDVQPVTVSESLVTVSIQVADRTKGLNADDGFYGLASGWETDAAGGFRTVEKEVKLLVLDNGLLRVVVAPELGMRVVQAMDKTLKRDLFHVYQPFKGSRVWDVGGVEASWPFFEHGLQIMAAENPTGLQAGGHRILRDADGSARIAMNLRFEYFQQRADAALQGRYSDRPLSVTIGLSPGSTRFLTSMRVDNPNATPRGDRLWNDAFFPQDDIDLDRIVFPARYAVHHFTNEVFDMRRFHGKPVSGWYDETRYRKRSVFALGCDYPFVGVYYPGQQVNRIRTHDPEQAPGIKAYVQNGLPFVEIWGSTGTVFEDPGSLVGAFEPVEMRHGFYATPDIGAVSYADDYLALGVDSVTKTFKVFSPQAREVTVESFAGSVLAKGEVGPGLPLLTGKTADEGLVVKDAAGRLLLKQVFPLPLADHLDRKEALLQSSVRSYRGSGPSARLPDGVNLGLSLDARRGFNYELEGAQNNTDGIRDYQALKATVKAGDDPAVLLSLARVHYRYQRFRRALELCSLAVSTAPDGGTAAGSSPPAAGGSLQAQAAYLQGLIAWEMTGADKTGIDFSAAGPLGLYHQALQKLQQAATKALEAGEAEKAGKTSEEVKALLAEAEARRQEAVGKLQGYLGAFPRAYRPALLLAYLRRDRLQAARLAERDPGSLEALWVLRSLGEPGAESALAGLVKNNVGAEMALGRFEREATLGRWTPVARYLQVPSSGWGEQAILPAQ